MEITIDLIPTDDGYVFDVGDDEESCLFEDEEHAQLYAILLEIKRRITPPPKPF